MPKPLATWNPARDVWEKPWTENLLCEHLDVYSETFPPSGTMRNGELSESQTSAAHTTEHESSSSLTAAIPTPGAQDGARGGARPDQENTLPAQQGNLAQRSTSRNTSQPSEEINLFLPTPVASPSGNTPEEHLRKKPGRTQVTDLSIIATHNLFPTGGKTLPTPKASDGDFGTPRTTGRPPEKAQHLATRTVHDMPGNFLPTPNTMDSLDWREGEARKRAVNRGRDTDTGKRTGNLREEVHFNFGEYAPAIERWEAIIGRQAPPAATPSKTGRPQLNPRFSEWLMGLPDGWVTDPKLGLTRAQQLKAIGNGVCPQQATAALADMWRNIEPKPQENPVAN